MSNVPPIWCNWLEIPVTDFDRAKNFYNYIFDIELHVSHFESIKMGVFPHATTGCAIVQGKDYNAGENGPVVYLNADPDLTTVQNKIEAAGGKVIQSKKQISEEHGYMALFNDTEGNRLALWSSK